MASYRIIYEPAAEKVLLSLSPDNRDKVQEALERFATYPPADTGRHTSHEVQITGVGRAVCLVQHSDQIVVTVNIIALRG